MCLPVFARARVCACSVMCVYVCVCVFVRETIHSDYIILVFYLQRSFYHFLFERPIKAIQTSFMLYMCINILVLPAFT